MAWLIKKTPTAILDIAKAPIELIQCIDYANDYWYGLSPQQRDDWFDPLAQGILAQTDKLGKTLSEVYDHVKAAVTGRFDTVHKAWETGDWDTVARSAGQASGSLALEAATWYIHLPEAANIIKLADKIQESGVAKRVSEGLRTLKANDELNDAGLRLVYGINSPQADAFREMAEAKGLLIAPRYRNPVSVAWEELGALPKMEADKLKNVDEIDAAVLGYRAGGRRRWRRRLGGARRDPWVVPVSPFVRPRTRSRSDVRAPSTSAPNRSCGRRPSTGYRRGSKSGTRW